ncbi:MAG: protein-L-isoaspartate(D-aspartate) O-methyltransferase [Acidobacteriota bacterium]
MRRTVVIALLALAGSWSWGCGGGGQVSDESRWAALRDEMVRTQIAARGVRDARVLEAMRTVPRHLFVPAEARADAYADHPLPIGEGQTISQPYIVGLMSELLEVKPGDRVLEVGTGSGYQAAVLGTMGCQVYTVEIRDQLAEAARQRLTSLGLRDVHVRVGDGYGGWPEEAPFAGIVVTAAPETVPKPLLDQLAVGGHLVIPVGSFYQQLKVITRVPSGYSERDVIPVRFVPMTGEVEKQR